MLVNTSPIVKMFSSFLLRITNIVCLGTLVAAFVVPAFAGDFWYRNDGSVAPTKCKRPYNFYYILQKHCIHQLFTRLMQFLCSNQSL